MGRYDPGQVHRLTAGSLARVLNTQQEVSARLIGVHFDGCTRKSQHQVGLRGLAPSFR